MEKKQNHLVSKALIFTKLTRTVDLDQMVIQLMILISSQNQSKYLDKFLIPPM